MKAVYSLALVMATATLLGSSVALGASETDDRIESSFKDSSNYQIFLKDEQITISSKDGAVTLSGTVRDDARKSMAQATAKALPGVKSVDNRIMVLLNVNADRTAVSVNDGIRRVPFYPYHMTVQAQKEQTTEFAKERENEMSAAKASERPAETAGESINDASITTQVNKSLSSHRLTRALNTNVTTINGIVSISGKANNGTQKDLVTKLATDVNGVKGVVNHMTIEESMSKND